jgi:hypothetical protein
MSLDLGSGGRPFIWGKSGSDFTLSTEPIGRSAREFGRGFFVFFLAVGNPSVFM